MEDNSSKPFEESVEDSPEMQLFTIYPLASFEASLKGTIAKDDVVGKRFVP